VLPGTLLGRVGENGAIFVIGDRYEGVPGEEGKLFLYIAPSPNSSIPTGTYTVRIMQK
jgi:hypothetical protein